MILSAIVAMSENRVIGTKGNLPWHIPDELKRFKELTTGHPMIMGRKTFESLPKVLPGRRHYVITRSSDYKSKNSMASSSDDVFVVPGPDLAMEKIREDMENLPGMPEEVFVIGGGEIYRQMLPLCDRLYITLVKRKVEGEVFFPQVDYSLWEQTERKTFPEYDFIIYERKKS